MTHHLNITNSQPQEQSLCWAIVPAAGMGSRMQSDIPKQYLPVNGRPLIEHSIHRLLKTDWITGIVVAISKNDHYWQSISFSNHPQVKTVLGGNDRADSVRNALNYIDLEYHSTEYVLVHDAARPCLSIDDLELLHSNLSKASEGLLLADKISDTIKRDDGSSLVKKTVPREGLWRALTPQLFPKSVLIQALKSAYDKQLNNPMDPITIITDEASAVEALGMKPHLLQGRCDNIKVTKANDIVLAELILDAQHNRSMKIQNSIKQQTGVE